MQAFVEIHSRIPVTEKPSRKALKVKCTLEERSPRRLGEVTLWRNKE